MAEPIVLEQQATVTGSSEQQDARLAAEVGRYRELSFFVTAQVSGSGTFTIGAQTAIEKSAALFVNAVATASFLTFTPTSDRTKVLQLDAFGAYLRWTGWVSQQGVTATFSVQLVPKEADGW
ncbi:MAG: hypothetical protein FJ125_01725 [Deltaproteobacteria bacterium]|nr:hypothetical protein [Deltaproteobacteria bacterium]